MPRCKYCQRDIQGGEVCVTCYRARTKRCPACLDARGKLKFEFKGHWKGGDYRHPDHCKKCQNTRWIFEEPNK